MCLVISKKEKINSVAEVSLEGLGIGGNYVKCVAIDVISVGLGWVKRDGESLKVIILLVRDEESGKAQRGNQFLYGELTPLHIMKGVPLTI